MQTSDQAHANTSSWKHSPIALIRKIRPICVSLLQIFIVSSILIGIAVYSARLTYGYSHAAVEILEGRKLLANPMHNMGDVVEGEILSCGYKIFNISSQPIRLLGSQTSCTCAREDQLPLIIPPHSNKTITFLMKPSQANAENGKYNVTMIIYTSVKSQQSITLKAEGTLKSNSL